MRWLDLVIAGGERARDDALRILTVSFVTASPPHRSLLLSSHYSTDSDAGLL